MHKYGYKNFFYYVSYHVLPSLFWLSVIFGFDAPYVAIITLLAALIHECGHICALLYTSGGLEMPHGHIFGFRIRKRNVLSYRDEILILALGPLANIFVSMFLSPFLKLGGEYLEVFIFINTSTALSNLLPADGYDGYGILFEIFEYFGYSTKKLEVISLLTCIVLTFLSLYLIGKFSAGYWIFGVFFVSLTSKISKLVKNNVF